MSAALRFHFDRPRLPGHSAWVEMMVGGQPYIITSLRSARELLP